MNEGVDVSAMPTFVDDTASGNSRCSAEMMSEEQIAYFQAMGMAVPDDSRPPGDRLGDAYWDEQTVAKSQVLLVTGTLFHCRYLLLLPRSGSVPRAGHDAATRHRADTTRSGTALSLADINWHSFLEDAVAPIHRSLSRWNPDSLLSQLVDEQHLVVPKSSDGTLLFSTLTACQWIHRVSGGRFDPSSSPLSLQWSSCLETQGRAPDGNVIRALMEKCIGMERVVTLKNEEIRLLNNEVRLDLDAVSKGAGVDLIFEALSQVSSSFLFDWSGEGCHAGAHPSGRPWSLGIVAPPSLRDLFAAWRKGVPPSVTKVVQKISLPKASPGVFATSGDYFQSRRFGFTHLVNPLSGMCLQAGPSSVASVTILASRSALICDGLATAAMMFDTRASAHAFLHSIAVEAGLTSFFVSTRSQGCLDHSKPAVQIIEQPVFLGGLSLSGPLLEQLAPRYDPVALHFPQSNKTLHVSTFRLVSISPPLFSLLVELPLPGKQFRALGLEFSVLHGDSPPLVICAVVGTLPSSAVQLRRQLDSHFSVSVLCRGSTLANCSSLAVTNSVISFNVEMHSQFGVQLQDAQPGDVVHLKLPDGGMLASAVECRLREIIAAGDHFFVCCGVVCEII